MSPGSTCRFRGCAWTRLNAGSAGLAEIGANPSVGSVGDPSTFGLSKTELIRRHGPWHSLDEVDLATCEYIDWSRYAGDHHRLHGQNGHIAQAEAETNHYHHTKPTRNNQPLNSPGRFTAQATHRAATPEDTNTSSNASPCVSVMRNSASASSSSRRAFAQSHLE